MDENNETKVSTEESETPVEEAPAEEPKSEPAVPYSRFKEVNDSVKSLKKELEALKSPKQIQGEDPEAKAEKYLTELTEKVLSRKEEAKRVTEQREREDFKEQVDETLLLNPDVKRADFIKFLEKDADELGVQNVGSAMKLYKRLEEATKGASDKTKKEIASKPGLPKSDVSGKPDYSKEDKGKSLGQIASEITRAIK